VKGFAVTLCIGILANIFTAVYITRLIFDFITLRPGVKRLSINALFSPSPNEGERGFGARNFMELIRPGTISILSERKNTHSGFRRSPS